MLLGWHTWACLSTFHALQGFFWFFFCKYGQWKTNGFSALIVRCHLASHPCISLPLSLSALSRIVRDAVWAVRSLRCDIEYTVKASRPTHQSRERAEQWRARKKTAETTRCCWNNGDPESNYEARYGTCFPTHVRVTTHGGGVFFLERDLRRIVTKETCTAALSDQTHHWRYKNNEQRFCNQQNTKTCTLQYSHCSGKPSKNPILASRPLRAHLLIGKSWEKQGLFLFGGVKKANIRMLPIA